MKYLIIGNGTAGLDAAQAIRKNDETGAITLVSRSENSHYYRPRLIEYLADDVTLDKMTIFKPEFYEKNKITNILGREIVSIDPEKKIAVDDTGEKYSYDRLLIATGANPFLPPIEGVQSSGVFTLRGVTDADRIKDHCRVSSDIVVIGGGLLGLETANSLNEHGKRITVVEFAEWLLPRQLDKPGGKLLQGFLEERGIEFVTQDSVSKIISINNCASEIELKSGKKLAANTVIISTGVRAEIELAKSTGIDVNHGILVNDHLETSIKDIYAAGDNTEHNGKLYGIWPAAREQGRAAGENMAGLKSEYTGTVPSTMLKITDINLYSAGNICAETSEIYTHETDSSYMKFIASEGKPVSAIVLNDRDAQKTAKKVMEGKEGPAEFIKLFQ